MPPITIRGIICHLAAQRTERIVPFVHSKQTSQTHHQSMQIQAVAKRQNSPTSLLLKGCTASTASMAHGLYTDPYQSQSHSSFP